MRKKSESATSHYGEYSTDSGLIVPALSSNLRNRLFAAAKANGISRDRLVELVARSTSEITIQLLGGSHRLNPLNSHQVICCNELANCVRMNLIQNAEYK